MWKQPRILKHIADVTVMHGHIHFGAEQHAVTQHNPPGIRR